MRSNDVVTWAVCHNHKGTICLKRWGVADDLWPRQGSDSVNGPLSSKAIVGRSERPQQTGTARLVICAHHRAAQVRGEHAYALSDGV